MMPKPRTKLQNISFRNQSLQDILKTCSDADEIIAVSPILGMVHNTRIIVKMKNGKTRAHFYNRLELSRVIAEAFIPTGNLTNDIKELNTKHGCDFTDDDLEIVDNTLKAKLSSLGYVGAFGEPTPPDGDCAIAINRTQITPPITVDENRWFLKVNGVDYDMTIVTNNMEFDNMLWNITGGECGAGQTAIGESEEQSFEFTNMGIGCFKFELTHNPEFEDEPETFRDLMNNPTFKYDPILKKIEFTLSPFMTSCNLENAKTKVLKPVKYDTVLEKEKIEIYARVITPPLGSMNFDDPGATINNFTVNRPVNLPPTYPKEFHTSPRHPDIKLQNNIRFVSFSIFLHELSMKLRDYCRAMPYSPMVLQTSPEIRKAFLSIPSDLSDFSKSFTMGLSEVKLVDTLVDEQMIVDTHQFTDFVGMATDAEDLVTKLIDHFKPQLQAVGYTVEPYSFTNAGLMASTGMILTKTTKDNIRLNFTGTDRLEWAPAWGNLGAYCDFVSSDVVGTMVTEETIKDQVHLILHSTTVDDFPPGVPFAEGPARIILMTRAQAGLPPDNTVYDWILENNNGERVILDNCDRPSMNQPPQPA